MVAVVLALSTPLSSIQNMRVPVPVIGFVLVGAAPASNWVAFGPVIAKA